jgi:hypothetical protein
MNTRASLLVPAVLIMAATASEAGMSKCLERDGRCMAVTVNGQQVVKLSKRTKGVLKDMEAAVSYVDGNDMRETRYEIPVAIRGALEVTADRSADSGDWFGDKRSFETTVVPLDQVDLKTSQQLATVEGVTVGGGSPLVIENVLAGNRLPPGRYLLVIDLHGMSNWDRMKLYVQVEE